MAESSKNLSSHSYGGWNFEIKVAFFLEALEKPLSESVPLSQSLVAAGNPWLVDAAKPIYDSVFPWCCPLCVSLGLHVFPP